MAREEFDIYNYVHKNKFKLDVKKPKTIGYKTPISWMPLNEVKIINGKFNLIESLEATNDRPLATEVKRHFLEIISTYNSFAEQMKRNSDIVEMAETLGGVIDAAKTLTLQEADDWFDKVTIKRNMQELDKLDKSFDKVAVEARALDNRLAALYEDMGNILGRYYEISDVDPSVMKQRLGMKGDVNESNVNWKDFYSMAKDSSGYNPQFQKKYGKLLDRPHIVDALKKSKDFNSFVKFVKQFESVTESIYTVKVSKGGNSLGKKTVIKSELKETVAKLKEKYKGSTVSVLNESGKVVKTIK
jgi:hypothetical protein